ncbi:MAG: response regulator [Desulfobacterales bacterium]|nr:response regulator [Desulfobacterales bacterium]
MKILIADDELVSRKTLEIFIQKLGHQVTAVSNGKEALEAWVRENHQIVITDWVMPEMDGLELISKIRASQREDYCYMILVTGRNSKTDIIHGIDTGADDYITKPFDKHELEVRIKAGERVLNFQSKDIVIFALAKLAESRDEDTGNHLQRVRYYSRAVAERMYDMPHRPRELDRPLIENIFLTSPLHDIGKVAIPDYVLLKPARLDDTEFGIMKSHAEIGYQTLKEAMEKAPRANYLRVAAQIARHHHEQFDGSGYPLGLKGEEIPLCARIFSVADVYDALVSRRPYKKPFSHNQAISIIKEGNGKHFDPMVIQAFLDCEDEIQQIRERFSDDDE